MRSILRASLDCRFLNDLIKAQALGVHKHTKFVLLYVYAQELHYITLRICALKNGRAKLGVLACIHLSLISGRFDRLYTLYGFTLNI